MFITFRHLRWHKCKQFTIVKICEKFNILKAFYWIFNVYFKVMADNIYKFKVAPVVSNNATEQAKNAHETSLSFQALKYKLIAIY